MPIKKTEEDDEWRKGDGKVDGGIGRSPTPGHREAIEGIIRK